MRSQQRGSQFCQDRGATVCGNVTFAKALSSKPGRLLPGDATLKSQPVSNETMPEGNPKSLSAYTSASRAHEEPLAKVQPLPERPSVISEHQFTYRRGRDTEAVVGDHVEEFGEPLVGKPAAEEQDRLNRADRRVHGQAYLAVGQVRPQRSEQVHPLLDVVTLGTAQPAALLLRQRTHLAVVDGERVAVGQGHLD